MDAVRRLASLARAAREQASLRVRQPLASMKVAVPAAARGDALEAFLEERVGYCEQFAATFAAMARAAGIPSRVAVGYTPGVDDA